MKYRCAEAVRRWSVLFLYKQALPHALSLPLSLSFISQPLSSLSLVLSFSIALPNSPLCSFLNFSVPFLCWLVHAGDPPAIYRSHPPPRQAAVAATVAAAPSSSCFGFPTL